MKRFRFVYLVSGRGRLMETVLRAVRLGIGRFEIAGVIGDRICRAVQAARQVGIPAETIRRSRFSDPARFHRTLFDAVERFRPDGIALNYNRMVRDPLLRRYAGRIVNIHYALLPAFPGLRAVDRAWAAGIRMTGVTTHSVDAGMDTGPIIAQAAVPFDPRRPKRLLERALFRASVPLWIATLNWVAAGRLQSRSGRRFRVSGVSYGAADFCPDLPRGIRPAARSLLRSVSFD
ncbi:MAG: phosphoribosylglycinamide formyltransferase [Candidatus Omnitrophica bacterium CG11_big_fil_rev_8_21_14_0_20_64_10]|nr:MAG: phosphoribosylglycinamide formyltransferase [Candidatus Omnitrophica bacterium CG11_big_fil_rev_8_21_14_0_20_64_10]